MKRSASVRAAVAKSRDTRLRVAERRLGAYLWFLWRHDRDGHAALVACLRRVITGERERSRSHVTGRA